MKYCILLLATFFISCNSPKPELETAEVAVASLKEGTKVSDGALIHNVYFWMKDDADLPEFEKALQVLGSLSSIKSFYWGKHAKTQERDVIDHSYDYAINVIFDSVADHDAYQIDPLHLKFVDEFGPQFDVVKVYDNEMR